MLQFCNAQFKTLNIGDSEKQITHKSLRENKNYHLQDYETNTIN